MNSAAAAVYLRILSSTVFTCVYLRVCLYIICVFIYMYLYRDKSLTGIHTYKYVYICIFVIQVYHDMSNSDMYVNVHTFICVCTNTHTYIYISVIYTMVCLYRTKQPMLEASWLNSFQQYSSLSMSFLK